MHHNCTRLPRWLLLPLALACPLAHAADSGEIDALRTEVQQLREQVEALRSLLHADPAPAADSLPPRATAPATLPQLALPAAPTSPAIRLYGYVKADAFYQDAQLYTDAIPFWVSPAPTAADHDASFGLTAKESRFGIDLRGPALGNGVLRAQYEFDFYGNTALSSHHAYTPRTRQAWVEWQSADWTVRAGQTWETYLITFPQTVNFSSYNFQGQLGLRRTQIRLQRGWRGPADSKWDAQVALAEPLAGVHGADLDGNGIDDGANSALPVFESKLTWQRGALKLGLAGFYGQERLTLASTGTQSFDSWAVILGGEIPLTHRLTARGTIWQGTNLDSAWGGIGQGINLDRGRTIDGTGGWLQLGWAVTPQFSANLGYSLDDPADEDLNPAQRTFNQTALLNGFYRFNDNLLVGLEYLRLRTGYKDQPTASANRLQSTIKCKF